MYMYMYVNLIIQGNTSEQSPPLLCRDSVGNVSACVSVSVLSIHVHVHTCMYNFSFRAVLASSLRHWSSETV